MTQPERSDEAVTPITGGQPPVPPLLWAACRLISVLAAFSFAPLIGRTRRGWAGLALGFAVVVPLTLVLHYFLIVVAAVLQFGLALSFGVIVLLVMGFLWFFNRRQFDIIKGELSEPPVGGSVKSAAPITLPGPPPGLGPACGRS